jgi:hypothetical protein
MWLLTDAAVRTEACAQGVEEEARVVRGAVAENYLDL